MCSILTQIPRRQRLWGIVFFLSAAGSLGLQIFFLELAGLEQELSALTLHKTAQSAVMHAVLGWLLCKEAVTTDLKHLSALLETAGKTAENRLKTLPFLSFDFN